MCLCGGVKGSRRSVSFPTDLAAAPGAKLPVVSPVQVKDARRGRGAQRDKGSAPAANPFKLAKMDDLDAIRERELAEKRRMREVHRSLRLHERGAKPPRRTSVPEEELAGGPDLTELVAARSTRQHVLRTALPDRDVERQDLSDFVAAKREMFLVQYSLDVKKTEMALLEQSTRNETQFLHDTERRIEAEATKFDLFLKENDKSSVHAIKLADQQAKLKADKTQDVKRLQADVASLLIDISNNADQLKELAAYRQFLEQLSPAEWLVEAEKEEATGDKAHPLYFSTPQQLLSIFAELEVQNLSLITNSQETEETLQELQDQDSLEQARIVGEMASLQTQIQELEEQIAAARESAHNAQQLAAFFTSSNAEQQEEEISFLNDRVLELYRGCIGENEANISTLQMLTNIENKLEELLEVLEKLPPDQLAIAEKEREKQRRREAREHKLEAQKSHQEEKLRRSLERSQASPKKQTGKRLVYRSAPPKEKKASVLNANLRSREEEELKYYFT